MKPLYLLTACFLLVFSVTGRTQTRADDSDRYFTKVEVEAQYPGGDKAWEQFLNKHLRYPDDAVNNEISGTIIVQFIVMRDSTIKDVQAIKGTEKGGLREEAVKTVSESGKWVPAQQNGHQVNSYKKVPIKFRLERN